MRNLLYYSEILAFTVAFFIGAHWFLTPTANYGPYPFIITFATGGLIDIIRTQLNPPRDVIIKDLRAVFEGDAFREGIRKDSLYNMHLALQHAIKAVQNGDWRGGKITGLNHLSRSDPLRAELQKLVNAMQRLYNVFDGLEKRKMIAHTDSAVTPMVFTGNAPDVARSVRVLEFQQKRVLAMYRILQKSAPDET